MTAEPVEFELTTVALAGVSEVALTGTAATTGAVVFTGAVSLAGAV